MNLLFVTPYNFNTEKTGATNRVLGLGNAISNKLKVFILHQGENMVINKMKFIHYDSLLNSSNLVKARAQELQICQMQENYSIGHQKLSIEKVFEKTIDWYISSKDKTKLKQYIQSLLFER